MPTRGSVSRKVLCKAAVLVTMRACFHVHPLMYVPALLMIFCEFLQEFLVFVVALNRLSASRCHAGCSLGRIRFAWLHQLRRPSNSMVPFTDTFPTPPTQHLSVVCRSFAMRQLCKLAHRIAATFTRRPCLRQMHDAGLTASWKLILRRLHLVRNSVSLPAFQRGI